MKRLIAALLAVALAGCASGPREEDPEIVAIQDFIAVSELEPVERIRNELNSNYKVLNSRYIIFKSRRDLYLIEFRRNCWELFDNEVLKVDERRDARYMAVGFRSQSNFYTAFREIVGDTPGAYRRARSKDS